MPRTRTGRADSLAKRAPAQASKKTRARQFAANPDTVSDARRRDGAAGANANGRAAGTDALAHQGAAGAGAGARAHGRAACPESDVCAA